MPSGMITAKTFALQKSSTLYLRRSGDVKLSQSSGRPELLIGSPPPSSRASEELSFNGSNRYHAIITSNASNCQWCWSRLVPAGSIRFEAHRAEEGARSAPAGPLAARSRGSETESTDRRRAHHSCPKAAQTSNCLIRTPFLRHLSRRVVRVEIGQKPGVVRGTGSSNPSPSSGESGTNRAAPGNSVRGACRNQAATQPALGRRSVADGGSDRWGMAQFRLRSCALRHRSCEC